jgi:hypothetical protein
MRRAAVCDKCIEIDKKIAHFRNLATRLVDPATLEGTKKLIEEMEATKVALHCDDPKK